MAGANKMHWPRHGSLQFWPRKRAKRIYPRIKNWASVQANTLLGFPAYKVGMTHVLIRDNDTRSKTKNLHLSIPVTVVECPPIKTASLRFYQQTTKGLQLISEVFSDKLDKTIKKQKSGKIPEQFDVLKAVVYTQPKLTNIGKKQPELLEIAISGKTNEEKLTFGKTLLERDVKASELFDEGQFLDIHAVTKGKGFQGTVKRYGVRIRQHKSEKTKRGVGTLGAWTPKKVSWRVPQPGKMGFHQRTEYNKQIMKIDQDVAKINQKGGFLHYGLVKNEYFLIKGSVAGPTKRTIVLTQPMRARRKAPTIEITYISQENKQ